MAEILLTSETFVKEASSISDNMAGKYLRSSIREAQEIYYRGIVGDGLLDRLKALVASGEITLETNAQYKALLDRSQDFLANRAIVQLLAKIEAKVVNLGVVKTRDENVDNLSQDEVAKKQYYYQTNADSACLLLQNWLLENAAAFPELDECACRHIHANLRSAASCGLFLGGPRGKVIRRGSK